MIRLFFLVVIVLCFWQKSMAQGDHFSIWIGPSMVYADNSGEYSDFKFKVKPALAFSINKQLNEKLALRGTIGMQIFDGGEYDLPYPRRITNWGNKDQAFAFKGSGYYVDALPIFTTNPNATGMLMSTLQFYAGLGFGFMFTGMELKTLKSGVVEDGLLVEGDIVISNENKVIPYIPFKTGVSTNLSDDWDFALEFALFVTTNSELDGNNIKFKQITPDMTGQILFSVKRYFGKAW